LDYQICAMSTTRMFSNIGGLYCCCSCLVTPFLVPYQINNQGISSQNVVSKLFISFYPYHFLHTKKTFLHLLHFINIDPFEPLKFCNLKISNKLQASNEFFRRHECLISMKLYRNCFPKVFWFFKKNFTRSSNKPKQKEFKFHTYNSLKPSMAKDNNLKAMSSSKTPPFFYNVVTITLVKFLFPPPFVTCSKEIKGCKWNPISE
jgi:hypothetical protein